MLDTLRSFGFPGRAWIEHKSKRVVLVARLLVLAAWSPGVALRLDPDPDRLLFSVAHKDPV